MKLWQKNTEATDAVTAFTVGKDREMDTYLAKFDVIGSLAHVKMLGKTGLLTASETQQLVTALRGIYKQIEQGQFPLRPEMEDIHSQVEWELTQQLGDTGKKSIWREAETIRCWLTSAFFFVKNWKKL